MAGRTTAFSAWIAALDERHLADLRPRKWAARCGRSPRATSSAGRGWPRARRSKPRENAPPSHCSMRPFISRRRRTSSEAAGGRGDRGDIVDLGCGTGAAGAAWASAAAGGPDHRLRPQRLGSRGSELDLPSARHPRPGDPAGPHAGPAPAPARAGHPRGLRGQRAVDDARARRLLPRLLDAGARGAAVLIVEPIARRLAPWWAAGKPRSPPPAGAPTSGDFPRRCRRASGSWRNRPDSIRRK